MPDFWPSCGYRLLAVDDDRRLRVRDDFLRSYLLRPELAPVRESCRAEIALHETLLADPRAGVTEHEIAAVADPDARDNLRIWLRFRDRLLDAPTLEAAYVGLFEGEGVDVPPLFVHQLTQILLRHILGADADPIEARAALKLHVSQPTLSTQTAAASSPVNSSPGNRSVQPDGQNRACSVARQLRFLLQQSALNRGWKTVSP